MKVTWEPARQAKKPRTAGSQQPACTHQEHQMLSTAEAASFACQFWVLSQPSGFPADPCCDQRFQNKMVGFRYGT